jgi:drug/metabolite transporter (DMT)-like permease
VNGPHALGLLAGLGAAACWALASLLYRRVGTVFSPLQLNLWKGVVASLVLGAWLWITPAAAPALPGSLWGLLLLSGALGIGLGDSAYFAALNRLGERHTILVAETLAPLFTLLLAGFWLRGVARAGPAAGCGRHSRQPDAGPGGHAGA